MIHWNREACRRAALHDDDLVALSSSSESGYSLETVQRFLEALPKPARPAPLPTAPRVLYVDREIAAIVKRNPGAFGQVED